MSKDDRIYIGSEYFMHTVKTGGGELKKLSSNKKRFNLTLIFQNVDFLNKIWFFVRDIVQC